MYRQRRNWNARKYGVSQNVYPSINLSGSTIHNYSCHIDSILFHWFNFVEYKAFVWRICERWNFIRYLVHTLAKRWCLLLKRALVLYTLTTVFDTGYTIQLALFHRIMKLTPLQLGQLHLKQQILLWHQLYITLAAMTSKGGNIIVWGIIECYYIIYRTS